MFLFFNRFTYISMIMLSFCSSTILLPGEQLFDKLDISDTATQPTASIFSSFSPSKLKQKISTKWNSLSSRNRYTIIGASILGVTLIGAFTCYRYHQNAVKNEQSDSLLHSNVFQDDVLGSGSNAGGDVSASGQQHSPLRPLLLPGDDNSGNGDISRVNGDDSRINGDNRINGAEVNEALLQELTQSFAAQGSSHGHHPSIGQTSALSDAPQSGLPASSSTSHQQHSPLRTPSPAGDGPVSISNMDPRFLGDDNSVNGDDNSINGDDSRANGDDNGVSDDALLAAPASSSTSAASKAGESKPSQQKPRKSKKHGKAGTKKEHKKQQSGKSRLGRSQSTRIATSIAALDAASPAASSSTQVPVGSGKLTLPELASLKQIKAVSYKGITIAISRAQNAAEKTMHYINLQLGDKTTGTSSDDTQTLIAFAKDALQNTFGKHIDAEGHHMLDNLFSHTIQHH